jgi:hypothetical protein
VYKVIIIFEYGHTEYGEYFNSSEQAWDKAHELQAQGLMTTVAHCEEKGE